MAIGSARSSDSWLYSPSIPRDLNITGATSVAWIRSKANTEDSRRSTADPQVTNSTADLKLSTFTVSIPIQFEKEEPIVGCKLPISRNNHSITSGDDSAVVLSSQGDGSTWCEVEEYPAGASSELLPEDRGTDYAPPGTLPPNAETISAASKDLLKRLLQPDPRLRLRSLLSLQRIAFYMGYDLQSFMMKKESPFRLLGRKVRTHQERMIKEFSNFDSSLGGSISRADDR
ncbi:hypothetical protein WN55_03498 [Dufourea novaeangliae]|uniref:Uncharacterized protein n=1 Tax=Dufourea novaeangliae TaxID=178035 RepID=A0A154PJJ7_DUFNO|nr:hypothetical protein WN55_03498 [Dufourea novaeangliae]